MDLAEKNARRDEKQLSVGIDASYIRGLTVVVEWSYLNWTA